MILLFLGQCGPRLPGEERLRFPAIRVPRSALRPCHLLPREGGSTSFEIGFANVGNVIDRLFERTDHMIGLTDWNSGPNASQIRIAPHRCHDAQVWEKSS